MNTAELVAKIADAHCVSKVQAKSIVDDIFKDIVDAAASGAEVSLPGFGKFKVKATPEREGRNPANGEKINLAFTLLTPCASAIFATSSAVFIQASSRIERAGCIA